MSLWVVYVGLIAVGLFLNSSKLYDVIVVLFMGFLAWINTDAADYGMYLTSYVTPLGIAGMDPGWVALCELGKLIGLSYNGFACFLTIATMSLMVLFARRTTDSECYFLALFLLYPGLISLVQFRQFVASVLVVVGMLWLNRDDAKGIVGYIAIVFIAFALHRSAIVMLSLLLIPANRHLDKRLRIAVDIALVALLVYVMLNAQFFGSMLFGDFKTAAYLHLIGAEQGNMSGAASFYGGLRNCAMLILTAGCTLIVARLNEKSSVVGSCLDERMVQTIRMASIYSLVLVPFVMITSDFMRFQRYLFIPLLVLMSNMRQYSVRHPVFSSRVFSAALCALFYYEYIVKGASHLVLEPLLSFEYLPALVMWT